MMSTITKIDSKSEPTRSIKMISKLKSHKQYHYGESKLENMGNVPISNTLTTNLTWIEIGTSKEQPLGRSLTPPSTSSLRKQGKERYKKAAPVTLQPWARGS